MHASQRVLMELWTNVSLILQPGASACSPDSEVVAGRAVPPDGVRGSIRRRQGLFSDAFFDSQLLRSLCQGGLGTAKAC